MDRLSNQEIKIKKKKKAFAYNLLINLSEHLGFYYKFTILKVKMAHIYMTKTFLNYIL